MGDPAKLKSGSEIETIRGSRKVKIRYSGFEDAMPVRRMINQLVDEKAPIEIQKKIPFKEIIKWLSSLLADVELENSILLVAENNGIIIGSAMILKKPKPRDHIGELTIFVKTGERRKGIGEKLITKTISEAKKIWGEDLQIVTLRVFAINAAAINFAKKMGFKEECTIKSGVSFYGTLVDEIIMAKSLT